MTFTITAELLLDGVWTDVSADVRQADGVRISRGRPDQASSPDPSSCSLTLNNRHGKYSPRNPVGPYYGLIGRNTQIRVSLPSGARFYGEVSAWPQRWDKTGRDMYTPIQAYGVKRRLGQGAVGLRSVMYRGMTSQSDVVAYWPCEDSEGATEFASGLPGHDAMRWVYGDANPAQFDGFIASDPLPMASNAGWTGAVPVYSVTGLTQVNFLLAVPSGGVSTTSSIIFIRTTGSAQVWTLNVDTSGALRLQAFNAPGTQIADSGFVAFGVNGKLLRVSIELDSTTSDVDWAVSTLEVGKTLGLSTSGTLAGRTIGRIRRLTINPSVSGSPQMDDVALGHISVHNAISSIYAVSDELNAYSGEYAADRISRLCGEEGIPVTIVGTAADSTRMGPQVNATLLEVLASAAEADMGILYEPRDSLGLAYRTRASMYAQDAALTLDYTTRALSGIEPVEDDDAVRNDITVSRVNGSSARAQLESGPLSVNAPPDGVGRYDDEVSISVQRDEDLSDQATWRLHMGTVDEARYPVLGFNLANGAFTSDAGLTADAAALDVGDRIVVTDAPALSTSPEDIQQIAQGFTETITPFEWLIDANCTPAAPWDVGVWDDTTGPGEARYSSDGTTLVAGGALLLTGVSPGHASTPDDASLDIVGDIDIRVHAALNDWTPTSAQAMVSKWTASGSQRSWQFLVLSTGILRISWTTGGISAITMDSTVAPGITDGQAARVRVTLDVDNGASGRSARFYTSADGTTWTQLGSTVTVAGVTSIHSGTAPVTIGASDVGTLNRMAGRVFSAEVRSGIDGTVVANPSFGEHAAGSSSFVDSAGKTWTVTSPAAINGSQIIVDTPTGPVWSDDDAPFDVMVGGERMTVTAITGTGTTQAFTVTRAVNDVIKGHSAGAELALAKPAVYAL